MDSDIGISALGYKGRGQNQTSKSALLVEYKTIVIQSMYL